MATTEDEPLDIEEGEAPKGGLKPIKENTPLEMLVGAVALVAVGTAAAAMVIEGTTVVFVAGVLSCVTGPLMYFQQTQITDIKALKDTTEKMRNEVDRLEVENQRLKQSVEQLTETVGKLEDHEQALDAITETQGQNVEIFIGQVEEHKKILAKLQENQKSIVIQNIIDVIYRADLDGDGTIDEPEIENLLAQIKGVNGVNVEEGKFRAAIAGSGGSMSAVIDLVKGVLAETEGDESTIHFSNH